MTIADLIKSTLDSSKERMKTPIVGSFICSFLLFNWKPIYILFFSDEKAESKINTVNLYFTGWNCLVTILIPLLMVCVYTFLVPMLMVWIDQKLEPTKEKRIKGIYRSKGILIKEKISIAGIELELKNALSENKDIQTLLDKIKFLEDLNTQSEDSNKHIITNLNEKLEQANKAFEEAMLVKNRQLIGLEQETEHLKQKEISANNIMKALSLLTEEEIKTLHKLGTVIENGTTVITFPVKNPQKLEELGLIKRDSLASPYSLTELGTSVRRKINELLVINEHYTN